ncbi:MAG TPA: hypothetical protein VFL34_05970, partial [Candidatus Sulfotelmatobacter sp.]|nr:hypothetical protein [Candidatus Sulfotelmatobacter sp.]
RKRQEFHVWLAFIPFAAFAGAFFVGAVGLWFLAKRSKISQTETKFGKALHVETPVGTLDVRPEAKLDPRLAPIPIYPGAMPENPMAVESITDLKVGWKTAQDISATYWTPDGEKQVWDFYRQHLPDWPQNLVESQGKELIRHAPGWTLLIRVSSRRDRTIIETSVKPPEYPHVFA